MDSSRIAAGWRLGVLLVATLAAGGCGFLKTENAADTTAPPPPPPPPPTSSAPPPLPPRPFAAPLDGVDPCKLLTADQRSQLGFDREPLADTEGGFGDAPTCSFRNSGAKVGARLSLVTAESMNVWTDDTAQVEATPVVVAGFPGLVIKTPDLDLSCNVAVDVADGQHLDVLFRDDGAQPPAPLDQLCRGAQRVADNAVTSLIHPESRSSEPPTSSSVPSANSREESPSTPPSR
jgi:hypothetical protein